MNRKDFEILNNNLIYLDNGATTLKPKVVVNSINDYLTKYSANAHRGDYDISFTVDTLYEGARDTVKEFLNASRREEIVFTSGATASINMIVDGYFKNTLKKGDEVLITKVEHASNVLPWFRLSKELGIVIKYIELDSNNEVTIDNLKKCITPNTKVISLAHITNTLGDIRPIKEITKLAHENNILVVVDGAQSVPHIKVDVKYLDIDFLAFSAHKMLATTGLGVLYGKYDLLNNFKPTFLGGGMNESFDDVDKVFLKELPTRLEAGTQSIEAVLSLDAAIKYINSIGIDNITKHEQDLKEYAINKLKSIPHIKLYNKNTTSGIILFNVEGIFSQDVAYYLNKYNICIRAGNHCAKLLKDVINTNQTCRASLYLYNTYEEIDKLVELLSDKERILKEMI